MHRSTPWLPLSRSARGLSQVLRTATAASLAWAAACLAPSPARAVTIDMVTVGNAGNANDYSTGYGGVNYDYKIGKYEVTIQQYTDFLNAVAATDPYALYSEGMATDLNIAGISRSGTSGGYTYSVIGPLGTTPPGASSPGNRPITYVSWFDAARFANWMHNGQGSGSTETGAYTLVDGQTTGTAPAKNPGAKVYIPTQNEWYKAAFYSPVLNSGSGGYYTYATQSNAAPGNNIGSAFNQANYRRRNESFDLPYAVTQLSDYESSQNYLTDVGAFTNSASYYGTFDQSANVSEFNDLTGAADVYRGRWGGDWADDRTIMMSSSGAFQEYPAQEQPILGFRLASPVPVPEPSTWVMGLAGIACAGWGAWRRRKRACHAPA